MSKKEHKSKMKGLFRGFRKSTTDLSEWNKNDDKLMKAVEQADLGKIESILSKKTVNPTKLGIKGLSVFHVACSQGRLPVVEVLISHGAEVNALTIQGNTSVQLAARDGFPKVVERLVQAGGVVDHKDALTLTALHHACARTQLECVQVLLKHGADANSRDKTGKPPLFYAAYSGEISVCKELLDRGANVNGHDEQQLTPLMAAAKKGHAEICALLLRKGADPDFRDLQGHNALSYGLDSGHEALQEVFKQAPTRASWDVQPTSAPAPAETAQSPGAATADIEGATRESPKSDMPEADQDDVVAEFVHEPTPEFHRKELQSDRTESAEVIQILTAKVEEVADEDVLAERAASPPQSVIEQRTLEAYKELEEENEQVNEDLRQLTQQHRRLQEAYDALKVQLTTTTQVVQNDEAQEMEEEIQSLKGVLSDEQEKNNTLVRKIKKLKSKMQVDKESDEDSWNDSDEELFSSPARKSAVIEHKPQTLMLLQNQVTQLRQDNKQLREKLQSNTAPTSDSSPDIDHLKHRVHTLEGEKQTLLKQMSENSAVFPEEERQNMMVLEQENTKLHSELQQLRTEINLVRLAKDSKPPPQVNGENETDDASSATTDSIENAIVNGKASSLSQGQVHTMISENDTLRTENALLTEELESLRDTYNKLVIAGDNLQDTYDQLVLDKEQVHEEYEKVVTEKDELVKENEYLLADGNAMHEDIEKLVLEVEKLQEQSQVQQKEKEELEKQLLAVHTAGKASDIARLIEERDKFQSRTEELEGILDQMKHDHEVVLEEVQSVQEAYQKSQDDRQQLQQEYDSLQDEFEVIQQQQEGLQLDYKQLEQDYADLLSDKEKLEQDFLDVQTASVQVEHRNPVLTEERDTLQQENGVLAMEKEQLDMTIKELSKSNALLQEEITNLRQKLKRSESDSDERKSPQSPLVEGKDKMVEATVEKDRRIRSLQIQISRLQQQLAEASVLKRSQGEITLKEADHHYRDVITTYRTHLLSAVQGHMDPDVKQALYNIIELRSMEQFC